MIWAHETFASNFAMYRVWHTTQNLNCLCTGFARVETPQKHNCRTSFEPIKKCAFFWILNKKNIKWRWITWYFNIIRNCRASIRILGAKAAPCSHCGIPIMIFAPDAAGILFSMFLLLLFSTNRKVIQTKKVKISTQEERRKKRSKQKKKIWKD